MSHEDGWLFGNGTRFVWHGGADEKQVMEGALVEHVEPGFVAVHERKGGGVGKGLKRAGHAVDWGNFGGIGRAGVEHAGFDGPGAAHAPGGADHFLDETELYRVGRLVALDVLGEEGLKRLGRFVLKDETASQEAVAEGILGSLLFSRAGGRAERAASVGAGCENSS
jgi:hypothetical protein